MQLLQYHTTCADLQSWVGGDGLVGRSAGQCSAAEAALANDGAWPGVKGHLARLVVDVGLEHLRGCALGVTKVLWTVSAED